MVINCDTDDHILLALLLFQMLMLSDWLVLIHCVLILERLVFFFFFFFTRFDENPFLALFVFFRTSYLFFLHLGHAMRYLPNNTVDLLVFKSFTYWEQ